MKYKHIKMFFVEAINTAVIIMGIMLFLTYSGYSDISISYNSSVILFLYFIYMSIHFISIFDNTVAIGFRSILDLIFAQTKTVNGTFLKCISLECSHRRATLWTTVSVYYYAIFIKCDNNILKFVSHVPIELEKEKLYSFKHGTFSGILISYEALERKMQKKRDTYKSYKLIPFFKTAILEICVIVLFIILVAYASELHIYLNFVTTIFFSIFIFKYGQFFINTVVLGFKTLNDIITKKDKIIEAKFLRCEPLLRSTTKIKVNENNHRIDYYILFFKKKDRVIRIYCDGLPEFYEGEKYRCKVGKTSNVLIEYQNTRRRFRDH